jgi:hypothetical protein
MDIGGCEFEEQATVKGDRKIRKTHWACGLNIMKNVIEVYLQRTCSIILENDKIPDTGVAIKVSWFPIVSD